MGKKRHTQDKLWITYKELVQDWGGKSEDFGHRRPPIKRLPFYCCSLSFMPFRDPVCLPDGTIFDIINILPYIKKFRKNPVTGKPLKASELIKLNFHKNEEGDYHCPVTYKVFTENSTIIAIKETGNVYSYEAYDELNKKPKNFKDLLTNQPFDPKNVILIQDPNKIEEKNINEFDFVKNREDLDFIKYGGEAEEYFKNKDNFVNLSSNYLKLIEDYEENPTEEQKKRSEVLNMINNKQNIEEEDERIKKIKKEHEEYKLRMKKIEQEIDNVDSLQSLKKYFRVSTNCFLYHLKHGEKSKLNENLTSHDRFSEGKASSSFTSTYLNPTYKNKMRVLSDDELRNKTYYPIVKSRQSKGYVRLTTNYGFLNLQIHCDLVPKTSENFLELCENGYYNNVTFHRLVKNFVVQGGDPTGTGSGGTSIFGKAFEDEFHPKLTHSSRGILSMANSGKHTNSSQFFIILKPTAHLDNRHSVFGEVVGNLKVLDDIEAVGSEKDKPKKEIKILSTEVFTNPFRDVISDLLLKEFSEKYVKEVKLLEEEGERRIQDTLQKMEKIKDNENQEEVGKYLNKKRKAPDQSNFQQSGGNHLISDPYLYEKPVKKIKTTQGFEFNDW